MVHVGRARGRAPPRRVGAVPLSAAAAAGTLVATAMGARPTEEGGLGVRATGVAAPAPPRVVVVAVVGLVGGRRRGGLGVGTGAVARRPTVGSRTFVAGLLLVVGRAGVVLLLGVGGGSVLAPLRAVVAARLLGLGRRRAGGGPDARAVPRCRVGAAGLLLLPPPALLVPAAAAPPSPVAVPWRPSRGLRGKGRERKGWLITERKHDELWSGNQAASTYSHTPNQTKKKKKHAEASFI